MAHLNGGLNDGLDEPFGPFGVGADAFQFSPYLAPEPPPEPEQPPYYDHPVPMRQMCTRWVHLRRLPRLVPYSPGIEPQPRPRRARQANRSNPLHRRVPSPSQYFCLSTPSNEADIHPPRRLLRPCSLQAALSPPTLTPVYHWFPPPPAPCRIEAQHEIMAVPMPSRIETPHEMAVPMPNRIEALHEMASIPFIQMTDAHAYYGRSLDIEAPGIDERSLDIEAPGIDGLSLDIEAPGIERCSLHVESPADDRRCFCLRQRRCMRCRTCCTRAHGACCSCCIRLLTACRDHLLDPVFWCRLFVTIASARQQIRHRFM